MARRPSMRPTLALECLETRQLLSTTEYAPPAGFTAPNNDETAMLMMVNSIRQDPNAAASQYTDGLSADEKQTAAYYGLDLNAAKNDIRQAKPQQPLAWNSKLAAAARGQSQDMADHNFQSHNGSDGSDPNTRAVRQGYQGLSIGENGFAYARDVQNAMDAFMADWGNAPSFGHRSHIQEPNTPADQSFREVGFGLVSKTGGLGGVGPLVVTQVFGRQADSKPFLLGAAFHDDNGNGRYDAGEGSGGVDVDAVNTATGQDTHTKTWASGGWQMQLDPGTYQVTGRLNGKLLKSVKVKLGGLNQEVDFDTAHPATDSGNGSNNGNGSIKVVEASAPPVSQPVRIEPQVVVVSDQAKQEQAARDQAARDQAARDQAAKDQAARDQAARDQAAKDQAAKDQAARDQAARDQAARDQAARDQAARDQAAKDQAARDQAVTLTKSDDSAKPAPVTVPGLGIVINVKSWTVPA